MTHHHRSPGIRYCSVCGTRFDGEDWQRLCWRCWRARRDREMGDLAYERGYSDGYVAGAGDRARASFSPALDRDLIARAVRLCHPDRHPPERASEANAITARLLELRGTAA